MCPKYLLMLSSRLRGPWPLKSNTVGWHALLQVVDVVLELVEEVVPCLGVPVVGGAWAAEGGKEVLEDAESSGGGGLVWKEGVGEGEGHVLVVGWEPWPGGAGGCPRGRWHRGDAGEGSGEQERRGAMSQAGL